MARPKKIKEIVVEAEVNTSMEAPIMPVDEPKAHSQAYLSFKAHIEKYAQENPEKYALKKESLLARLNIL